MNPEQTGLLMRVDMTKSFIQNICFAPGLLTDLDEIMAIERASFSHPWTEGMVLSELFDNPFAYSTVVRERDESEIIAYLFVRVVLDELHLMDLAVHSAWRKKGIAETLIQHVFATLDKQGLEKVILEVRASNLPAQGLYRKLGFYQVGERRKYYSHPTENALLFQMDIGANSAFSMQVLMPEHQQTQLSEYP